MNESNILKNNNNQLQYFLSLVDRARYILIKRYDKPLSFHDVKMINDILYNEKNHYVEAFKEYLIYEDYNEFIKRFYKSSEIKIKLPKILIFYEKYSKIYANYTVIPESKYMYKNIKRKQKMIDQIQNNNINSEYEEDEESNEDMSNTVFSSRVINSIYKKTLTISNKSMNSKNTEQSVNNFLDNINNIENNVKTMKNKEKAKILSNNFLGNKIKSPSNDVKINSNSTNNNINNDKKFIDILINNNSKKNSQNKNINPQNKNNLNQKSHNKKNNNNNLIYINSYKCKRKNYVNTFKNNNSIGGCIISANNTFNNSHNNTFFGNNYLKTNSNFPRQELFSLTCRQNFINNSNNNITDQKDNINLTNINNYCNNVNIMNNKQKNKLSLRETLFKLDKLVLSTNSSISPKILNENPYPTSSNKPNLYNNKNNIKEIPTLPNLCYKSQDKCLPIQNVANISISEDFSMIITKKGNGILFGDNTYGQLGKGHRINVKSAQILQKFKNKIKMIKSSENMNLLLTKNDDLYIWNICSNDILIQPSMIYFPKKIKIDSISTGKNFSILLSSNGICYGIGSNDFGELGLENNTFREIPEEIITLSKYNERIIQVRCGFKHVVCVSRNGRVYTWGNNSFGQLGHINTGNNFPNYVNIEDKGERVKIIQVSAGFRSSFFFSNKGVIYYTGVLNEQAKSFVPIIYLMDDKDYRLSDDKNFLPVKIWGTYARNKSIFYATFADVRSLQNKFVNKERIKDIVFTLAEKWISDDITAPFIPHISKYFESSFMKI